MGTEEQIELTQGSAGAGARRRRLGLWGVLAAAAVAAGALVVSSAGDDSTSGAPKLPIALGGRTGAEAAMAADASLARVATYVPADDLPALGGRGGAYRLVPPTEADVARVAAALGVEGEAQRTDVGWEVQGDSRTLTVPLPGGTWWYGSAEVLEGGGSSGVAECVVDESGRERCSTSVESDCVQPVEPGVEPVEPGVAPGEAVDGAGQTEPAADPAPCPDQPPVPADPPEGPPIPVAEAEAIAGDLYAAAGGPFEVTGVEVMESSPSRLVTVLVEFDGVPVEGVGLSLSIDPSGTILDASGVVGGIEQVGSYDLLDTQAAIDRLNEEMAGGIGIGPAPMPMPAEDLPTTVDTTIAPGAGECKIQPDGSELCEFSGTAPPACESNDPEACKRATLEAECVSPDGAIVPCGSEPAVDCPEGYEPAVCGDVDCPPVPLTAPPPTTARVPTTVLEPDAAVSSGSAAAAESATVCPPVTTVPPELPEPAEVLVTGAERILLVTPSHDGSELYLVPGYRFTAEDGSQPVVAAIVDDAIAPPGDAEEIAPPPSVDECEVQPRTADTTTQTSDDVCPETVPTTINPCPTMQDDGSPAPERTVPECVEGAHEQAAFDAVAPLYHCGIEPIAHRKYADLRWVADPAPFDATNAPEGYVGRGVMRLDDPYTSPTVGSASLYVDSSGIEVPMVAVGADWQPPPCD